jgi:hypothetical protein
LKKEIQLSKDREINLQKWSINHFKLEDQVADGEIGTTFLINQVWYYLITVIEIMCLISCRLIWAL